MVSIENWWLVRASRVVFSLFVLLLVPPPGWAVNIGGQVNLTDTAKNQPSLRIQISGIMQPGTATGGFDYENWKRSGFILPWNSSDANPPPYSEADASGNFQLQVDRALVEDTFGEPHQGRKGDGGAEANGDDQEFRDLDARYRLRATVGYRITAGYEGFYTQQDVDRSNLWKDNYALSFGLKINNYTSYIDFWKPGFDAHQAGQTFEQETGHSVLGWEKYFGDGENTPSLSTSWAPANGIRNDFNWGLGKDFWIGSENNAVTNTAPAQGLFPHTWVVGEDSLPIAHLFFRRTNHD